MSRSTSSLLFEGLGRATWALNKRRFKQRALHGPSGWKLAVGALAVGVVAIGAVAARTGASD